MSVKIANDYAAFATRASHLATEISPLDNDSCAEALKLAVYHLRSAAMKLQQVAEFKAEREKTE